MVNNPFLPPSADPAKHLSPSKIVVFPVGTGFADKSANPPGLGEPATVYEIRQQAWESGAFRIAEGEPYRCRIRFSSDFRGRWCWNDRWMSSPTMLRTSTLQVSRPIARCSRNI